MKKIFFLMIVLCSTSAFAQQDDKGFYTRFDTGLSFGVEKNVDRGRVFKTGFGQRVNDFMRFELTANFFHNHLHGKSQEYRVTGKMTSRSITGNVVLDLPVFEKVVPFVFGGLGGSINRLNHVEVNDNKFNRTRKFGLVWQAGAGLGIKIHPHFMIDLTYDYTNLGKFKISPSPAETYSHKIRVQQGLIGIRYLFDE